MNITPITGDSPFDSIKQVRTDGSERWSARDLWALMGYSTWQKFENALERAMQSLINTGHDTAEHFTQLVKNPSDRGGRPATDYLLTRYAAYVTVMNGDPKMEKVAAAQAYFAVKTREAEVATPVHPELVSRADLARMVLAAEEEKAVLASALKSAEPAIAYHDRYVSNDDAITVKIWGGQYRLTEPQAYALLREKNVVYRKLIGQRWSGKKNAVVDEYEYRARADFIPWFDLRPQHNAPRHHNGQVRQTLYVRQEHAIHLASKVGLSTATLPETS